MIIRDAEKYSKRSIQADRNKEQIYGHKGKPLMKYLLQYNYGDALNYI